MTHLEEIPETVALDLARECLYRFLSAVATDPYTPGWERIQDPQGHALAIAAADLLRDWAAQNPTPLTFGELPPEALDLRPLVAALSQPLDDLRADHDRIFGLVTPKECPPYETEYHPPGQTFLRSQQTADIAGFYHAFGLQPGGPTRERPDHIALELEFLALLLTKKRLAETDKETATGEEMGTGSRSPRRVPVPISDDTEVIQDSATDEENGDWLRTSSAGACPPFPVTHTPREENGDWLRTSSAGACPPFPTPTPTQRKRGLAPDVFGRCLSPFSDANPHAKETGNIPLPGSSPTTEQAEICDKALRDFVQDHLAWWVPAFAAGLRRKADHGPYHALANILAALIPIERTLLGIAPPFQPAQPALIETPEDQPGCVGCTEAI